MNLPVSSWIFDLMASQPTPPPNVPPETRPNLGLSNYWFPLDKAGYETLPLCQRVQDAAHR